jgi:hypothetical protein
VDAAQAKQNAGPASARAFAYQRRTPETSLLYEAIRKNLKTFLSELDGESGAGLPRFVASDFERYLRCGILAYGFARVRCGACGEELLVAFSCKSRSICPSCTTRRMQSTALQLVDAVLPAVPTRQWVLSLPRWARFLLARDPTLITRMLDHALRTIFAWQRKRARRQGAASSRAGAVTFVQRFGGALNLNVHFHCVLPDGVWVRNAGALRFCKLDKPTDKEVQQILLRIERRVRKLLKPRMEASREDSRTRGRRTHWRSHKPNRSARSAVNPPMLFKPSRRPDFIMASHCTRACTFTPMIDWA